MDRTRSFLLLAVVIALFSTAPVVGEDVAKNSLIGAFTSVASDGTKFDVKDRDGRDHTFYIAPGFQCILEDVSVIRLADLPAGQRVRVTVIETDKRFATKVAAMGL